MNVTFSGKAEDQFREIQAAFRDVSQELANRFAEEVRSAVWRIEHFPLSGQDFDGVRRVVLRRSRYLMLYMVRDDGIYVTKLVHQKENRDDAMRAHEEIDPEVLTVYLRRLEEMRSGKVTPIPFEQLLDELDRIASDAPGTAGKHESPDVDEP